MKKGVQKLNGKQTLDLVRYRKSNRGTEESSDHERNLRQQQVLDQLLGRVLSLGGITKIAPMMDALGDSFKTEMPPDRLSSLLKSSLTINRSLIRFIGLNGQWESPYIVVKEAELEKARRALKEQLAGTTTGPAAYGLTELTGDR